MALKLFYKEHFAAKLDPIPQPNRTFEVAEAIDFNLGLGFKVCKLRGLRMDCRGLKKCICMTHF
jgi:hypothetical protein